MSQSYQDAIIYLRKYGVLKLEFSHRLKGGIKTFSNVLVGCVGKLISDTYNFLIASKAFF